MEEEKKKKNKAKYILLAVLFIGGLTVILFVVSTVICFINELINFSFSHVINYLFTPSSLIFTAVVAVGLILYGVYLYFKNKKKKGPDYRRTDSNLYDKARFLTKKELDEYYGFENKPIAYRNISKSIINGLIINSFYSAGQLYMHSANGVHNLVVGTTGTGKTKCLLIPTTLMMAKSLNKPSMIILDIKGEIMEKTYNTVKEEGYETHILDLRNPELSECYNPLKLIIDYYQAYLTTEDRLKKIELNNCETEIGNLAKLVVPSLSKGDNTYFEDSGRDIFKAIIYAMLEDYEKGIMNKEQFSFQTINNINALNPLDLKKYFEKRDFESRARRKASSLIQGFEGNEMNKTTHSVWSSYKTSYEQFIDLACQDIVLKSDFETSIIREKPTAIYILVPDENQSRYPLASLIINQIYSTLVNLTQKEGFVGKRDIHFILDEFANLPKFENIVNWLSVGRERKMFVSLFLQSISQLNGKYGVENAKAIIQNCNMKICIGISENDDKKYFSNLFGQYTVITQSSSSGFKQDSGSTSESLSRANLVNETDLSEMKLGEVYFIELKKHPGHTQLLPIFNEDYASDLKYTNLTKEERNYSEYISDKTIYSYTPERKTKEEIQKEKNISFTHPEASRVSLSSAKEKALKRRIQQQEEEMEQEVSDFTTPDTSIESKAKEEEPDFFTPQEEETLNVLDAMKSFRDR